MIERAERLYQYKLAVSLGGQVVAIATLFAPSLKEAEDALHQAMQITSEIPPVLPEISLPDVRKTSWEA